MITLILFVFSAKPMLCACVIGQDHLKKKKNKLQDQAAKASMTEQGTKKPSFTADL